jgi:hypothetical protein
MPDQKIELRLKSQAPEHNGLGQTRIARVERRRFLPQKIGSITAAFNAPQDVEGDLTG